MTTNPELKPCPFCGGEANFGKEERGGEYIQCGKCRASTCLIYPIKESSKVRLTEYWNTRQERGEG